MQNRSVPVATVLPQITYRSLSESCRWLIRVFGFHEAYRYGTPVAGIMMRLGDAFFMMTTPRDGSDSPLCLGGRTQMLTIIVPEVDGHYAASRREGAKILEELHETVYGERQYVAEDPEGHRWLFSQHARDLAPGDWGATTPAFDR